MGYTKHTFNKDFFKEETCESFYLAGFIAADGWIYEKIDSRNKKHNDIGISLKENDKSHLQKIQNMIKSNHKLYKRVIKNSKRNLKYNDSISYTLLLYSPEYIEDLKKFGIHSNKSLTYNLPDHIKNHKYINSFLAGYFDGDGSIGFDKKYSNGKLRKTPQARLHLRGTKEFLTSFHDVLFKNCEIPTETKIIGQDSGIGSLQYTGNNNVHSILKFLYGDSNILCLDRKYEKYIELENIITKNGEPNAILS